MIVAVAVAVAITLSHGGSGSGSGSSCQQSILSLSIREGIFAKKDTHKKPSKNRAILSETTGPDTQQLSKQFSAQNLRQKLTLLSILVSLPEGLLSAKVIGSFMTLLILYKI